MGRPKGSVNASQSKIPENFTFIKRIRKKDVMQMMGWSKATLERKVKAGEFLQPVVEAGIPYWFLPQVIDYLTKQFNVSPEEFEEMKDKMSIAS
jgi:hypothetical protein